LPVAGISLIFQIFPPIVHVIFLHSKNNKKNDY
jgi:hypothetical protein